MFKKNISYFFIVVLLFCNPVFAFEKETAWLLNIKKSDKNRVKNLVEFYARQTNMPEVYANIDYSFVLVSSGRDDYWLALYEQHSDDVCFFLYSPRDKKNVQQDLKIRFKKNNMKYLTNHSSTLKKIKIQEAENIIKDFEKQSSEQKKSESMIINVPDNQTEEKSTNYDLKRVEYDFSDAAQAEYNSRLSSADNFDGYNSNNGYKVVKVSYDEQKQQVKNMISGMKDSQSQTFDKYKTFPSGITLFVSLQSAVNTSSLDSQDRLSAVLKDDVCIGDIIIPSGSLVYGSVTQSDRAGSAYRNGVLTIKFDTIMTLEGEEYFFQSKPIIFKTINGDNGTRVAKITGRIAAATLSGIAFAALSGAIGNTGNWGKNLSVGAVAGALGGGLSLIGAKGEEVEIKEGTVLTVVTE